MRIYFATSNPSKVDNATKALEPFGIEVVQIDIELIESRAEEPEEIALEKARQTFNEIARPLIVEDSGFFIRVLNGFPRTHIKFSQATIGVAGVMKLMEGVKDRHAEWRMSVAYVWGPGQCKNFTYVEPGLIADGLRPINRAMMSDYWRIYIPTVVNNDRSLSEMDDDTFQIFQDHFALNNQFAKLGGWLKQNRTPSHPGRTLH